MARNIRASRPEVTLGRKPRGKGLLDNLMRIVQKTAGTRQQPPTQPGFRTPQPVGAPVREPTPMQNPAAVSGAETTGMQEVAPPTDEALTAMRSPERMLALEKMRKSKKPTLMG